MKKYLLMQVYFSFINSYLNDASIQNIAWASIKKVNSISQSETCSKNNKYQGQIYSR